MEEFLFDEEQHKYFLHGKELPSVTRILESTIPAFEKKYDGVSEEVLKQAAEKGTLIHKEIESYIKRGYIGFTAELSNFINIVLDKKLINLQSEVKVHNDKYAGTIDIIGEKKYGNSVKFLADIKTTAKLDKEYVSWQLSLYNYLLKKSTKQGVDELYAIWLRDDKCKFVKVEKKKDKEIKALLECFEKGEKYQTEEVQLQTVPLENQMAFCSLFNQMKEAEKQIDEIKKSILKEMEKRGIKNLEIGNVKITYKEPTIRKSVDTKRLKEDNLYEKYTKEIDVKSSISISLEE